MLSTTSGQQQGPRQKVVGYLGALGRDELEHIREELRKGKRPKRPEVGQAAVTTLAAKGGILIHSMFNHTEWQRQHRKKYPERYREYSRNYYHRHKEDPKWRKHRRAYERQYFQLHPEYHTTYAREWNKRLKAAAIEHYGKACACCGESTYEFLCIDHINGGGNKQREQLGCSRNFYSWLKRNHYPEGFRTLCHNCNQALGYSGYCPHQQKK